MNKHPFLALTMVSLVPTLAIAGTTGGLVATDYPNDDVYAIDATDASVTFIGTITGATGFGALELGPDGYFYSLTMGTGGLYRIDPFTWQATFIGLTNLNQGEGGLAIDASGQAWYAFGGTSNSGYLFQIDLTTGAGTTVGYMGNFDVVGLDVRSDGVLIGLDRINNALVMIDPATATTQVLAPLSSGTAGDFGGLVIESTSAHFATCNQGSAFPGSNQLFEFDPYSGVNTPIGVFSAGGQGPEGFLSLAAYAEIGVKYCITNSNSTGMPADLSASGSTSSVAGNLTLTAFPVPNQFGIFFHGHHGAQVPFGCSFLCAAGAIQRGAVITGVGNIATYTYDNSDAKHNLSPFAGATRYFQYWFRDPMGAGMCSGETFNTSNAMAIAILP